MKKTFSIILFAAMLFPSCTREKEVTFDHPLEIEVAPAAAGQKTLDILWLHLEEGETAPEISRDILLSVTPEGASVSSAMASDLSYSLEGVEARAAIYGKTGVCAASLPKGNTPSACKLREEQVSALLDQTLYAHEGVSWIIAASMQSPSPLDSKYGLQEDVEGFSGANELMTFGPLVDCVAGQNSIFTPSSSDGTRWDFIYAGIGAWPLMSPVSYVTDLGLAHYPAVFSITAED